MISIIISSHKKHNLARCLRSIQKTMGIPYELLVTENPGKYSLSCVYNHNAHEAKHEYLLFLHEDT